MIHGISPFSIYNPPAVRDIHPADIPAASPGPVTSVLHPMAQELLYDRWDGWFNGMWMGRSLVLGCKMAKLNKKKMACKKPRCTPDGPKKFVVKGCQDGTEKIIRFGDPNMRIKKSIPARRKSFRARHKCSTAKSKLTARYWSSKIW